MAPRQIKMPVKDDSDNEVEEVFSQRKRPESGRYLLQVDRQTKGSYKTVDAAQAAGHISSTDVKEHKCMRHSVVFIVAIRILHNKLVADEFFGIANGLKPDRFGWLTPVKVDSSEPVTA